MHTFLGVSPDGGGSERNRTLTKPEGKLFAQVAERISSISGADASRRGLVYGCGRDD